MSEICNAARQCKLRDAEAAESGQDDREPVAVVAQSGRAEAAEPEKSGDEDTVDGEE